MYDAWAVFDEQSETYFLNKSNHGYYIPYQKTNYLGDKEKNREVAISYAAFRVLNHRYEISPGYKKSKVVIDKAFSSLGYDPNFNSIDYSSGNQAGL